MVSREIGKRHLFATRKLLRATTIIFATLVISVVTASYAFACSIVNPPGYDREGELIKAAERAKIIVEIKVISSSSGGMPSSARVKVEKVLRGDLRVGATVQLLTSSTSMCGAGQLAKGERGMAMVTPVEKGKLYFSGFMTSAQIAAVNGSH